MKKFILLIICMFCLFGCSDDTTTKDIAEVPKISYEVNHYKQNLEDDKYTLFETDDLEGFEGILSSATAKTYEGFTSKSFDNKTITEDLEINIYYDRNTYTLTLNKGANALEAKGGNTYKFGETVEVDVSFKEGYLFGNWSSSDVEKVANSNEKEYSFQMPAKDITLTANSKLIDYTITYELDGGTASNPETYNVESNITLNNPVKAGKTFNGWTYNNRLITTISGEMMKDITLKAEYVKEIEYTYEEITEESIESYTGLDDSDLLLLGDINSFIGKIVLTGIRENEDINYVRTITVPNKYDGKDVALVSSLIYGSYTLTNVVIEEGILGISNAFEECSVSKIDFPTSLVFINDSCFSANRIIELDLSKCTNLKYIGEFVFSKSFNLVRVILPESIEKFNERNRDAFEFCPKIIEVVNPSSIDIKVNEESNGDIALYAKNVANSLDDSIITESNGFMFAYYDDVYHLISIPNDSRILTLPSSFKVEGEVINEYVVDALVFVSRIINSLTIPNSVKAINDSNIYPLSSSVEGLFEIINYSDLNFITMDSLEEGIKSKAQIITNTSEKAVVETEDGYMIAKKDDKYYLMGIIDARKEVILPSSFIYKGENVIKYDVLPYTIYSNMTVEKIIISSEVGEIYENAFCLYGVKTIIIKEGATEFNDYAFSEMDKIKEIYLPSSLDTISQISISGVTFYYAGTKAEWDALIEDNGISIDVDSVVFEKRYIEE